MDNTYIECVIILKMNPDDLGQLRTLPNLVSIWKISTGFGEFLGDEVQVKYEVRDNGWLVATQRICQSPERAGSISGDTLRNHWVILPLKYHNKYPELSRVETGNIFIVFGI